MTKHVLTVALALVTLFLTSCATSSSYYEESLLQECRNQLEDVSISSYELENIMSLENELPSSSSSNYLDIDVNSYPTYELSPQENKAISEAKNEVSKFIKSSAIFREEDKEQLLTAVDLLDSRKIDEPSLPSLVYYSNSFLLIDNTRQSPLTSEDVARELMRFLRICAYGSIEEVPYQGSMFEKEMAYTILYSHFKDGRDVTGYNAYHQQILDFIGIFQQDALYGFFYGYSFTRIPLEDLSIFVSSLEQNDELCENILAKWYQQFVVAH